MNKGIWVIIVAAAFVAGTMTTGTIAYAAAGGQGNDAIVQALESIANAINGINPTVDVDPTPVNINVEAPQGPQGPPGIFSAYAVPVNIVFEEDNSEVSHVQCETGDVATGFGYFALNSDQTLRRSIPVDSTNGIVDPGEIPSGWEFFVVDESGSGAFVGWIVCADITP